MLSSARRRFVTQAFDFFVQVANFPEFSCGGQIPVPGKYRIDELRPIWVKASFGVQNISRISPKYQTAISRSYNSNHGPKVILRLERARENCERHRCFGGCQLACWRLGYYPFRVFRFKKNGMGTAPRSSAPLREAHLAYPRLSKQNAGCLHARSGAHFRVRRRPRQVW